MSKELSLMDAQLPAHLQELMGTDDAVTDSLVISGPSFPRLSIKGSKFRLIKDGEEKLLKTDELKVVIVAATPVGKLPAKTFYRNSYNPAAEFTAPDCMSSDGIRPDAGVLEPQSIKCATCPQNAWGSAKSVSGKDSKACKDTKALYIVTPSGDGLNPLVVQVRVPTMSLKHLSTYARQLADRKYKIFGVFTTLSFGDSEFPELKFGFGGFLSENQVDDVREILASDTVANIMDGQVPIEPDAKVDESEDDEEEVEAPKPKAKKPAPKKKAAKKEPAPSLFEDEDELDDLLEEEEAPKPAPKKKAAAKKKVVEPEPEADDGEDFDDELEALLADL